MPYQVQNCKDRNNSTLADFQRELIGVWKNEDFGDGVGGEGNPLSYNIMPLPSVPPCRGVKLNKHDPDNDGYILKNFRYTERLRFNDCDDKNTLAIAATAPNRGGLVEQNCRALFYEQQVRFAEGPDGPENEKGPQVVHVENGAWLTLPKYVQQPGPYPENIDKEPVTEDLEQPVDIMIAKQMAIPHGNTIHALGGFDTISSEKTSECNRQRSSLLPGIPIIPDGATPYPVQLIPECNDSCGPSLKSNLNAYKRYSDLKTSMDDFQNPKPEYTRFPNRPLQEAVDIIKPEHYMHWYVTTQQSANHNGAGGVMNIPFEQRVSDVIGYSAEYWMLFKKGKKYLAYTQTILMILTINGIKYIFPHITCNTVTYCGG